MIKTVTMYMVLQSGNGRSWTFVVDNDKDALIMLKKATIDNWTGEDDENKIHDFISLKKLISFAEKNGFCIYKCKGAINSIKITIN